MFLERDVDHLLLRLNHSEGQLTRYEQLCVLGRLRALMKSSQELVDQIDNLSGVEFTRDIERDKSETVWDDAVKGVRDLTRLPIFPPHPEPR